MHTMKSTLFIAGLLCLLASTASAQKDALSSSTRGGGQQPAAENMNGSDSPFTGPAGGPSLAWHNFRQHRTANDIAPGVVLTWDIPVTALPEDLTLSVRPGLSYLHPTVLVDAVARLQLRDHVAVIAGLSFDFTGDREFRFEESTPEWRWFNEHDSFGKRSFAQLGLQIPTGFAYYELLYRVQLEKGSHAYYTDAARSFQIPAGYRRYFILSVGMGVWL
ncbi:MAG: hypothetical protein IH600_01695 [Bacteroidetes bacterium]|nr:hypothetical protein [Bacteroidota bacterium]